MDAVTKAYSENGTVPFRAEIHSQSLLGMQWNVDNNIRKFCGGAKKEVPNRVKKRAVLSFVASVFDPLGLFAPMTMRMRILLKTVSSDKGQQWDDEIDQEEKQQFLDLVQ